ncbi:MAG: KH domain-containing protein [Candidatus Hodarchaeota archaeon]
MSFKIPNERIGVLIGKSGSVKEKIESLTNTEITIDSKSGSVYVKKKDDSGMMIGDWVAKNIIKAISRGFNPKIAVKLMGEEYLLEIIDIQNVLGNSRKKIYRIKSRLIGESGKSKRTIESLANVHLSIYHDTVSIIGQYEGLKVAREAVFRLLRGQSHSSVYRFLQKKHDELKRKSITEIWKPDKF